MGLVPFYDAHCHYQDPRLKAWFAERGEAVEDLGIRKAVVNGTKPDDWSEVSRMASAYGYIIPSYGLHPWFVDSSYEDALSELEDRLDECLAPIGEIGLDRWIQRYDIELQRAAFISQLRLAKRKSVPVAIHCLRAWGMLLEVLQEEGPVGSGFLLHSYGGPVEMVSQFADIGAYFSISDISHCRGRKASGRSLGLCPWIDCWWKPIALTCLGLNPFARIDLEMELIFQVI